MNAHSLLAIIFILRDEITKNSECFMPWLMGSQSCERVFRSLRSMTGTFSTIVNFSFLGMLQRLHKLNIQEECQSKAGKASGICFPRQEKYGHKKDGSKKNEKFSINVLNKEIYEAMKEAEIRAKKSIETLCMAEDLKKKKLWDIPPIPTHLVTHDDDNDSDDENEEDKEAKGNLAEENEKAEEKGTKEEFQDPFIYSNESISDLYDDVSKLYESKVVDASVKTKVENIKKKIRKQTQYKKVETQDESGIPTYRQILSPDEASLLTSPFVEVEVSRRKVLIRKRTAVWLFQDTERVSADRLFRVRANQPFATKLKQEHTNFSLNETNPVIAEYVMIGDLCAFHTESNDKVKIGRVMQLIKFDKNQKEFQHKGNYVATSEKNKYGALCTWYNRSTNTQIYEISTSLSTTYYPLRLYLCTLTACCLENQNPSLTSITSKLSIVTVKKMTLKCSEYFSHLQPILISPELPEEMRKERSKHWVKCGSIILHQNEKNILTNGKWLTDLHVDAAHELLKKQFPKFGGFQSTLLQLKEPIKNLNDCIQIIHIDLSHWAVISTIGCQPNQVTILRLSKHCFNF